MSTRGAVAIKQDDGSWRGVYNRYDSYPTGLGKELFNRLKTSKLKEFAKDLLRYNTYKGFREGDLDIGRDYEPITSDNPDPLWVEWVYVIDVENEKLEVLTGKDITTEVEDNQKVEDKPIEPDEKPKKIDQGWHYGHCIFTHEKVAEFDLNKKRLDWGKLEDKVYNEEV